MNGNSYFLNEGVKRLESKQWTLFDYWESTVVEPVHQFDLEGEIKQLKTGKRLQYGGYVIEKNKYYEVEYANEYHELFHTKQALMNFLMAKGLI